MILHVSDNEARFLATTYPESGMGYQIFDGELSRMSRRYFLALNGEFVIPFSSLAELRRELTRVGDWGLEGVAERAEPFSFYNEPAFVAKHLGWRLAASLLDPEIGTDPRLREMITPQEIVSTRHPKEPRLYIRYSAFPVDRRVDRDGNFTPGTYATTFNDITMVPSGFAAVGRYALPSTLPAQFIFPIVTDASPIYVGTATPNYGQAGGGVEVLFPRGANPVLGRPHRIPVD